MAVNVTVHPQRAAQGTILSVFAAPVRPGRYNVEWRIEGPARLTHHDVSIAILGETTLATGPVEVSADDERIRAMLDSGPMAPGSWTVTVRLTRVAEAGEEEEAPQEHEPDEGTSELIEILPRVLSPGDDVAVTMKRAQVPPTADQALWAVIRNSTNRLGFNNYSRFMDLVMCGPWGRAGDDREPLHLRERGRREFHQVNQRMRLPFPNVEAYRLLKVATEVFMMLHCGVGPDFRDLDLVEESRRFNRTLEPGDIQQYWENYLVRVYADADCDDAIEVIPYLELIRLKLRDVPLTGLGFGDDDAGLCYGILADKLARPCFLELIWTYWHMEATLAHTMNAVGWRFQNRSRHGPSRDPLRNLEIDPLRPLNNLLWGWIQDEQHRLTNERIAYECVHEYGISPSQLRRPPVRVADARSRFIEAFHHLLTLCAVFYQQDDDTTVIADGFPVLNALKETHLLITQGAHNQYGDLPWVARMEGLMQQWMLGRPEMREFLPSRTMVAYPERWMDSVEAMKSLQGWTDVPVLHFRDLGVFGEQILLGIRYGAWATVNDPEQAANWARYWRPEVQGYSHAAGAVTGMDMAGRVDGMPGVHPQRRLAMHNGR
jgi:hypothetical protein